MYYIKYVGGVVMWAKTMKKAMELDKNDTELLYGIYQYRCLDIKQAHLYYFPEIERRDVFEVKVLYPLIDMDLIELVEYKEGVAIFLMREGIDIVRDEFELSKHIVDEETLAIRRGHYTAGELRMSPRLINHQVGLNEFALMFAERAPEELNWKHYGEKFVSSYFGIRPDGMIRFFDVDIFLEQDMNTESERQLLNKWDNYRNFLRSKEHEMNPRKIIVFFIVDNIVRESTIERRKNVVRFTAVDGLIDCFDDYFDMVIGTRQELLDYAFDWLIPTLQLANPFQNEFIQLMQDKHNFIVRDADKISSFMEDKYDFIAYRTDSKNNLVVENGRVQEFLFDDATFSPLSLMHKVDFHKRNSATFRRNMNRGISSVFIVDNEEQIESDLNLASLLGAEQVYFTTVRRLKKYSFHKALFSFDSLGNRFHFANSGLVERVIEKDAILK